MGVKLSIFNPGYYKDRKNFISKKMLASFIIILFLTNLFLPTLSLAETIILKSGKRLEGEILKTTDEYVKLNFNGSPLYYEHKYIESIEEETPALNSKLQESVDVNFHLKKGIEYALGGRVEEAEREFRKGLNISGNDYNITGTLNIVCALNKGVINKEYADCLFNAAYYLIDEDYEQAIIYLQKAHLEKPDDIDVCYNLGGAYYFLGRHQEALDYLNRALEIDPYDAESYALKGVVYYSLGQYRQARVDFLISRDLLQKAGDFQRLKEVDSLLDSIS